MSAPLPVDERELGRCIACGLCLPACPTWRVTGAEMASPRGRIAAMRAVQWNGAPVDAAFEAAMETCVQCRACEPVCPAFVPFGHLMEGAREALHRERRRQRPLARRVGEWLAYRVVLPRHWLVVALTWLLWLVQWVPALRRRGVPRLSARSLASPLRPSTAAGEEVVLFTGCVMDAWMRDTHRAAVRVVEAAGGRAVLPGKGGDCCGALHVHAGRTDEARALARRVMAACPGEGPVLVDSAGCGAAMKDYGRLLGTAEALAFSARVLDVHEWLAGRDLPVRDTGGTVVVQDPCHLRHVQRAEGAVRSVLAPAYRLSETADDGLCCGAGGSYNMLQPDLARAVLARKVEALEAAGGGVVVSANPGCLLHLRTAGVDARHPVELLADALEVEA